MKTTHLGNTGLKVSVLGLGGHEYRWQYAGNIKNGRHISFNPVRLDVVSRARECGINYFDTTFQEEVQSLGHVLAQIGGRDEIIVNGMIVDTLCKTAGLSLEECQAFIRDEIETRVKLLGSAFDIFMLGAIDKGYDVARVQDIIEIFEHFRQAGHFRFLGVSCHSYDVLIDFLRLEVPVQVVMFSFNYALWNLKGEKIRQVSGIVRDRGIGAVAMKPLCWTMYGIPFTAINAEWGDIQELVRHSFSWQSSSDIVHTSVVGVETVAELNSCIQGIGNEYDEGLLKPYLASRDNLELLARNGLKHSQEIQGRIVGLLRDRLGVDLGDNLGDYLDATVTDKN